MKVYLATHGAHSDYQVLHAFARREDAEAYELAGHVEEFELHEGPVETRAWYALEWYTDEPDGEFEMPMPGVGHIEPYMLKLTNPRPMAAHRRDYDGRPRRVEHAWRPTVRGSCLHVEGWDRERVLKVYGELRAEWLNCKALGMVWDPQKCEWTPGEVDA